MIQFLIFTAVRDTFYSNIFIVNLFGLTEPFPQTTYEVQTQSVLVQGREKQAKYNRNKAGKSLQQETASNDLGMARVTIRTQLRRFDTRKQTHCPLAQSLPSDSTFLEPN